MKKLHVPNDEYTRQWHLMTHINWRDNSSVGSEHVNTQITYIYHHLFSASLKTNLFTQKNEILPVIITISEVSNQQSNSGRTLWREWASCPEHVDTRCQSDISTALCHWNSAPLNSMRWSEVTRLPGLQFQIWSLLILAQHRCLYTICHVADGLSKHNIINYWQK